MKRPLSKIDIVELVIRIVLLVAGAVCLAISIRGGDQIYLTTALFLITAANLLGVIRSSMEKKKKKDAGSK